MYISEVYIVLNLQVLKGTTTCKCTRIHFNRRCRQCRHL